MSSERSHHPSAHRPAVFGLRPPDTASTGSAFRDALVLRNHACAALHELAARVGGIDVLEHLSTEPIADEPFDWTGVADADRAIVVAILTIVDGCKARVLDVEYRTIVRRLVKLVAVRDPTTLRRGSTTRTAAAFVWLAMRASGEFSSRSMWTAEGIWAVFGVSNCVERGRALLAVSGVGAPPEAVREQWARTKEVCITDVGLLHSTKRQMVVRSRESLVRTAAELAAQSQAAHPIVRTPDGNLHMRGRPVTPQWAARGMSDHGRATITLTLGECESHPEVLALSVPDARRLVTMLQGALDAPYSKRSA